MDMTSVDAVPDITPEQSKAARALLAWSQQELATEAAVATSTVADFERGVRTPVANNAQAIRDAFERRGLQFLAGGVIEKTLLPPPPPPLRPGTLMRWITATHLSQWGERRDGQSGVPELLCRLIYAALGPAAQVRIPSDESVQYPGWDAICIAPIGMGLIPEGQSVWEIGTQRGGIAGKAARDLDKRTAEPLGVDPATTTFVFLTPQRFPAKAAWAAEQGAKRPWRKVQVIDADDLVHWLEQYPAVAQWLAVKISRRPKGLQNLEEVWAEWINATKTPLTADIVLTDRDDDATAILKWVRGPPALLAIQAEAPAEALAVLYAAISPLPEAHRLSYWSRCVVADDDGTARDLVGLGAPLIVALTDPDPGLAERLVQDGHHVYAAYGPDRATRGPARRLARPWRHNLQLALTRAGLSDGDAHRYAKASGRSLPVLRRLMPAALEKRPSWALNPPPELIAAMCAGGWSQANTPDRKLISTLAGRSYDQVEEALADLASAPDGPLIRSGDFWKVKSLRDAWTLLGPKVTLAQLERFQVAFHRVLSTPNPRYERKPKNDWFEQQGEFGEEPSIALRRGLVETMIALGVFPDAVGHIPQAERRAAAAVRKLLRAADAALWWSLSQNFRGLAEASPAAFLESLEEALDGNDPPIKALFRSDPGFLHSTEYLSNLLWALEMLARSPVYITQVALVLAQLDEIDPGGKWANRPAESLRRIFLSWSPQTYAPATVRLRVIDKILKTYPEVGWTLLVGLAPKLYDTAGISAQPDWRDFSNDEEELVTWQTVGQAADDIGARLLERVEGLGRWRALLDLWANFPATWREVAVTRLAVFANRLKAPSEREELREVLRALLQKHRGFATAQWAMPEQDLTPLEAVFDSLRPSSLQEQHRWLFKPNSEFLRPNVPWETQQAELATAQAAAAGQLLTALTTEELFEFARSIRFTHALGGALAKCSRSDAETHSLLKRGLTAVNDEEAETGFGLLVGFRQQHGLEAVHALWRTAVGEAWGETAELQIVRALPSDEVTWAAVAARSPDLEGRYWQTMQPYNIDPSISPERVIDHFLAVNRGRTAMEWLSHNINREMSSELLIRVLRAALKAPPPEGHNDTTMFSHYLGVILNKLDADPAVDEDVIVGLEWSYFQALRYSQRPAKTLHAALARQPEFFVHLLKLVFLPAQESGVVEPEATSSTQAEALASQAYTVLSDWKWVPGANEAGAIDGAKLEQWVKQARKLLAQEGRAEIGDSKIGEILSRARREPNEAWPPEPVRDVIEMARSKALEDGFVVGVFNGRGVTVRNPFDGGDQERGLADRYRRDAEALRIDWMRTARCLDRIADSYRADAQREDEGAEQRDWL